MKNFILLIALLVLQVSSFSQKQNLTGDDKKMMSAKKSKNTTFAHDLTLIKPLINTNDSTGGYYSEYYGSDFNFMYCGAVLKNMGTVAATHVHLELKITDIYNIVLETYYSDTIALLNPGAVVTVNIPGQLTFQSWISNINQFLFIAKSDSIDENPTNDQQIVPFPLLTFYDWTYSARSTYMTTSYDIGLSGNFHSGDFIGFTVSTTNWIHEIYDMAIYIAEPWQDSLAMTAMIFRNGQLIDTAIVYLPSPPQTGWATSDIFWNAGLLYPDSSYYIGVKLSYSSGTHLKIGVDTSVYHNFGVESIARIGGSWFTTLNYVPLIQVVCDPEGINELENHSSVRIFPNPVKGTLFLENVRDSEIKIYDITGKLVLTDNSVASSRKFDVSCLAAGIYCLRMISKDRIDSRKIVVER